MVFVVETITFLSCSYCFFIAEMSRQLETKLWIFTLWRGCYGELITSIPIRNVSLRQIRNHTVRETLGLKPSKGLIVRVRISQLCSSYSWIWFATHTHTRQWSHSLRWVHTHTQQLILNRIRPRYTPDPVQSVLTFNTLTWAAPQKLLNCTDQNDTSTHKKVKTEINQWSKSERIKSERKQPKIKHIFLKVTLKDECINA